MITINRNCKDTLFTHLFNNPDKKYLLELYRALHPEDITADVNDLTLISIENTFVKGIYNDLGFMVRNQLIILAEAQSTWSPNILIRMLLYIAKSYQDYIFSNSSLKGKLYSETRLILPQFEAYVLYAGNKGSNPERISLKEEFFNNSDIDLVVNIIYADNERRDIIGQYLAFCMIAREQYMIHKNLRIAIRESIRICIELGNLTDYLSEHGMEVEDIMFTLLSQEEAIECYANNMRDEGVAEGLSQGLTQGLTFQLRSLKKFYLDFDTLYDAEIANNATYSQFSKDDVHRIYQTL